MAAGILRKAMGAEGERLSIESAGTAAWEGQPATEHSIEIARGAGVDLESHRSRRVTPELARAADLVLVMDRAHLTAVRSLGADPSHTHVLSEWPAPGDPSLPISDPFGASREAYEECWRRIEHHVARVVPQVREASRARSA